MPSLFITGKGRAPSFRRNSRFKAARSTHRLLVLKNLKDPETTSTSSQVVLDEEAFGLIEVIVSRPDVICDLSRVYAVILLS